MGRGVAHPKSRAAFVLLGVLIFAACVPGNAQFTVDEPAGFFNGFWHGLIVWFTFIASLFIDGVGVYEVANTGGWYDFGFLLGASCALGGGSHTYSRRVYVTRNEREWDELSQKVEDKVKRRIREWAEAEPDEDWYVVEEKAEAKLKQRVREWAETP